MSCLNQLVGIDSICVGDLAAKCIDLIYNVAGNCGGTVADKISFHALVAHAFFNGNCDFLADHCVFAFVCAVHGSVADCQGIYFCFTEKFNSA